MRRLFTFVLFAWIASLSIATAQDVCRGVARDTPLVDGSLYVEDGASHTWSAIDSFAPPRLFIRTAKATRRGSIRLVYAVKPAVPRSGVLNIRIRTQAAGLTKDTARIALNRPRLREPCGFRGSMITYRPYNQTVHTRIYHDYHDSSSLSWSATLDTFHFSYARQDGGCVRTDADTRRDAFQFGPITTGIFAPAIRAPEIPETVDSPVAGLFGIVGHAVSAISPGGGRTTAKEEPDQSVRYSSLISLLRRYDTTRAADGQQCVAFQIQPEPTATVTHVSITDFDNDPFQDQFSAFTWEINWQ